MRLVHDLRGAVRARPAGVPGAGTRRHRRRLRRLRWALCVASVTFMAATANRLPARQVERPPSSRERPGLPPATRPATQPGAGEAVDPIDRAKAAAEMERAAAAAEVVRLLRQRADAGVRPLTPEFVTVEVDWSRRLAEAVCESSGADRPRQVAAVEEHVRRARRARDVAQERHRRGLDASEVAAHMAAYAAAEAELWLDKVWAGTGGGGGGDRTGR